MADLIKGFGEMPDELLEAIALEHKKELDARRKRDPTEYFPWHHIQAWVFEAPELTSNPIRIILAAGGNRAGKSATIKGIWSQVIRRQSPLNKQLTTLDPYSGRIRVKGPDDPLTTWVIPPTLEKARLDWIAPSDRMGLQFWAGESFLEHREQPDNVVYTKTPGLDPWTTDRRGQKAIDDTMCDKTLIKSQDQALHTFESSAVDLALIDEELQEEKKWNSILLRVGTTNGIIAMAFTPLEGLTWSFDRYWKPLVKMGRAEMIAERRWIHAPAKGATVICVQMGCADNPLARRYAEEIEHDAEMSEAEKAARLHGEYGFVEGTLVPALSGLDVQNPLDEHKPYVIDVLPGMMKPGGGRVRGKVTGWYLIADPNKSYGAVLGCTDGDGNLILVTEHLEESWPNRLHAAAFRSMERRYATGLVQRYGDYGSAGAQSMVDLADFGLAFNNVDKGAGSVSASVKRLRGLAFKDPAHAHPITGELGAPRIYFYRPGMVKEYAVKDQKLIGCRTADQIGQARQTDNRAAGPDTPHKDVRSKLDLFDCVRYMAMIALTPPDNDESGTKISRTDRLPTDTALTPDLGKNSFDPLDTDFYVPDYSL